MNEQTNEPPATPAAARSNAQVFLDGFRTTSLTPCLVLFLGALGFGALARDLGFSGGHATFLTLVVFALPAQVILIDQIARGADIVAAAFAVSLTGVRLFPMAVTLASYLRTPSATFLSMLAAAHPIAVTVWVEGMRRLPALPLSERLANFNGMGAALVAATTAGTIVGYLLAANVPPVVSAAMLFMTPMYFMISMIASRRTLADGLAVVFGFVLGPIVFLLMPGFDLLIAGLVGGTAAHVIGRWRR